MSSIQRMRDPARARRYWRIAWRSVVAMVLAALILPLSGYVYVGIEDALAQTSAGKADNPRAKFWREVRVGQPGYSAVRGDETNVLIQNGGQNWRQLRDRVVANYGGWFLFLVAIAIVLFFSIRGRIPIEEGRSGRLVPRWSAWERFVHWWTAFFFVILTVTGLSLLFGRVLMIPLFGKEGFAAWAGIAKGLHNVSGPLFALGVLAMIIMWLPRNFFRKEDWEWLRKGGGIVGRSHPSAGFLNAGEKIWFWFICTVGVVSIAFGLMMDFPGPWGTRDLMQLANLIHGVTAIMWIALWMGHAYIGTLGTEGALEGMTTGYVDANWAKQHHDLWYAEVADRAIDESELRRVAGGRIKEA